MDVEIYSDIVCPWCYVGERRLRRALDDFEGRADVRVPFRPFQLDPAAPDPGEPLIPYMERRYGAAAETMRDRVAEVARTEGIDLRWEQALSANTARAHRLLLLVERDVGPEAQADLAERLFALHFTKGGDVSDPGALASEAAAVGWDEERAREALAAGEGSRALEEALERARSLGVRAVPTYVFEGRWSVEGAQSPESFLEAFRQVAAALEG